MGKVWRTMDMVALNLGSYNIDYSLDIFGGSWDIGNFPDVGFEGHSLKDS